jgi:hypothetical protein
MRDAEKRSTEVRFAIGLLVAMVEHGGTVEAPMVLMAATSLKLPIGGVFHAIDVLKRHGLMTDGVFTFTITPAGREFLEWFVNSIGEVSLS